MECESKVKVEVEQRNKRDANAEANGRSEKKRTLGDPYLAPDVEVTNDAPMMKELQRWREGLIKVSLKGR